MEQNGVLGDDCDGLSEAVEVDGADVAAPDLDAALVRLVEAVQ